MKGMMDNVRKELGARIRELRKTAGLTQEELGEKADQNYKFIGELERG
jgi:transcriptional regulator with XRE-family HTH domain